MSRRKRGRMKVIRGRIRVREVKQKRRVEEMDRPRSRGGEWA